MDDITKKMCRQLSEGYYTSNKRILFEEDENTPSEDKETPEEDSDVKKFTPDNEFLKTFIKEMKDYISSGGANTFSLTFNDLTFDKNLKWVVWSGNFVKKIDWKVVFQKNGDSGAFFTINNEKLEIDETKTLNLINVYLSETFLKKISEAIDDKTLESQQINQA